MYNLLHVDLSTWLWTSSLTSIPHIRPKQSPSQSPFDQGNHYKCPSSRWTNPKICLLRIYNNLVRFKTRIFAARMLVFKPFGRYTYIFWVCAYSSGETKNRQQPVYKKVVANQDYRILLCCETRAIFHVLSSQNGTLGGDFLSQLGRYLTLMLHN